MSRVTRREVIKQRANTVKRLEKELDKIHKAQSELGYIELDKPLRDGWIKTYQLRDDISRSKNAKVYKEVLKAVMQEVWGREKKHADNNWNEFFNKKNRNFQRPGIRRLNEKQYDKLSSHAKKCFIKRKRKSPRGYRNSYSCILPRYYFTLTYRRAYIYKRKIISPILESREQEIMEILAAPTLRIYSTYYNYHWRLYKNPKKGERRKTKMELSSRKIEII